MALQILVVAAVLDGRLTAAERRLVRDAQRVLGRPQDDASVRAIRDVFVAGGEDVAARVRALA